MTAHALRERVTDAYFAEAELLDAQDLAAWLAWVTDDFRYEVPIPVTVAGEPATRHSATGLLASETVGSVRLWISRLAPALVDSAYAENPAARTRHFVTNVRVVARGDGELAAASNVLLTWCRWNEPSRLLSAERQDILRDDGSTLRLAHRRVLLDSDVVRTSHLRVLI